MVQLLKRPTPIKTTTIEPTQSSSLEKKRADLSL